MAIGAFTDPMTSNSTTAPTGAGQITLLSEVGVGVAGTSAGGTTTTISGGSTTSESFTCQPCCYSFQWLPQLFGSTGICPGDIDNTAPVNLTATWNFTPAAGITLSDYCLASSGSFAVIADNTTGAYPATSLRVVSPSACPAISPPTTRVAMTQQVSPSYFAYFQTAASLILTLYGAGFVCNCSGTLSFFDPGSYASMQLQSYSCNPFSATWKNTNFTWLMSPSFLPVSKSFTLTLTE